MTPIKFAVTALFMGAGIVLIVHFPDSWNVVGGMLLGSSMTLAVLEEINR